MNGLIWWLRVTGALYVLNGIMMAVVKAPIRSAAPAGTLERAAAGDATAQFLSATWLGFGLEVIAIGVVLLIFSAKPQFAVGLGWSIVAIEIARGLIYDAYMLSRGYPAVVYVPWLVIHVLIIATGIVFLRMAQRGPNSAAGALPAV